MKYDRILRDYRYKNDLTQAKLAEILDVHILTVLRWENGKSIPHGRNAHAIIRLVEKNEPNDIDNYYAAYETKLKQKQQLEKEIALIEGMIKIYGERKHISTACEDVASSGVQDGSAESLLKNAVHNPNFGQIRFN